MGIPVLVTECITGVSIASKSDHFFLASPTYPGEFRIQSAV